MLCLNDNEKKLMESQKLRETYEDYFGTVYSIYELAKARTRNMTFEESIKESVKLAYEYMQTNGHPEKFFKMSEKKAQRFATRHKKSLEAHLSKQGSKTCKKSRREAHSEESDSDSVDNRNESSEPVYKACGGKGVCRKNIYHHIKLTTKKNSEIHTETHSEKEQETALPSETSDNEK